MILAVLRFLSIFRHHLAVEIMCFQIGFTQHIHCFSILLIRNTFTQVPVTATEKNFPYELKQSTLKYQQQKYYRGDEGSFVVLWKDRKPRKPVIAVSSKFVKGSVEVCTKRTKKTNKPEMIHNWNQSINGCDRLDQLAPYYSNVDRKTIKWWKTIFQWFIEIVQVNAYIINTVTGDEKRERNTFKKFKEQLEEDLCDKSYAFDTLQTEEKTEQEDSIAVSKSNIPKHLVAYVLKYRDCVVCSTPNNRKRTNFICTGCADRPFLYPKGYFLQYKH